MAVPNGLNPQFSQILVPCNALPAKITGGAGYSDATIKADTNAGTPGTSCAAGSIYIGGDSGTPGVWIAVGTTWTKLTVN